MRNKHNIKNVCLIFRKIPDDLFCERTHVIMHCLVEGGKVIGKFGKLHRKEVLRFMYKFDKISLANKIKIIFGMLK